MVCREDRWTIAAVSDDERKAIGIATGLLAGREIDAVRVIRVRQGWTGREYETAVFDKAAERSPPQVNLPSPIDGAAECAAVDDLLALPARMTANQVLRRYLDHYGLTAIELFHSFRELKRIRDADMLAYSAMGKVAALQTRPEGADQKQRSRALERLFNELFDRAREADTSRALTLTKDGLAGLLMRLPGDPADPLRRYRLRLAITRDLLGSRNLTGKLERALELLEASPEGESVLLMDGFIADILTAGQVVKDVLGPQPGVAGALAALIRLAQGDHAPERPDPSGLGPKLNRWFAAGGLPDSGAVLLDRVRREVRGTQPLARSGIEELEAFRRLLQALATPTGPLGGPAMAAALLDRFARLRRLGGTTGQIQAIAGIGTCFSSVWDELLFLVRLSQHGGLGENAVAAAVAEIGRCLGEIGDLRRVLRHLQDPEQRRQTVDGLKSELSKIPAETQQRDRMLLMIENLVASPGALKQP